VRTMRLSDEFVAMLDTWSAKQDDKPGRSEAMRRLVELGLKVKSAGTASGVTPLSHDRHAPPVQWPSDLRRDAHHVCFLKEFEMYFPKAAGLMIGALLPIVATIAPASAAAVTENFDFTLTGVAEDAAGLGAGLSGSGEVTGTLESNGSVLVTTITGTVDGSMIKKVVKVDGFLGNDNLIFPTATSPAGTPLVDGQGFAFKLANGQDVQVFGDDLPAGIFEIEGTDSNGAAELTLTAAVPESSTWAMMILGFCGLGFMAYRRKQNGAALSVA
jgi:hypothetical protein